MITKKNLCTDKLCTITAGTCIKKKKDFMLTLSCCVLIKNKKRHKLRHKTNVSHTAFPISSFLTVYRHKRHWFKLRNPPQFAAFSQILLLCYFWILAAIVVGLRNLSSFATLWFICWRSSSLIQGQHFDFDCM